MIDKSEADETPSFLPMFRPVMPETTNKGSPLNFNGLSATCEDFY